MAKFSIISKDGESVRLSGYPKYTGTFLGVSFLEFMSIESPTLIDWEIGDYIDYDRTGLRYKLYTLPIPKKQARAGSHGASFVYSNVKFYAETKDLEIAPFRDLVPEDNNIHFSTRPDVSTYENVYGLARRIQACMDDVFPGKWRIEVYDTDDTKLLETLNETKDFSISNSNCLQTLSQIYEKWDNIGWIHSYDSAQNVHVITIGRASVRDNENTSDVFAYGLGNGLTSIKKASSNEDEFATRLYIYGSDRNIQTRYYKEFDILNAESVDIRNLMLPISTWGKTDGLPDARKAYLEADQSIIEKYGLIPRTVYFDGSQNEAIYPSIQGLKMSQVREEMIAAGEGGSEHLPPALDIRIDRTGYIIISLNSTIYDIGDGSKEDVESNPTFLLSLPSVGFDIAEQGTLTSEGLATISMKSGPCAGREFKVKSYWGYTNQLPNGYHAYEVYRSWDESLGLGFPNKTNKINEGDEFVLLDIPMPDYYITLAEKRLLEAGQKKLAECTKVSPYYEPAIDPIKIKESGKALREGMYMQISDPDIIDTEDGKDYVLIDTLTIDEKADIPKYNVTLRKQKKTSKSFAALESRVGASEKSLSTLTTEKAGKTDTYSKANIDNLLKKYLLLEAASQTVKGDLVFDGNLLVKGDILSEGQFAAATIGEEGGGGGALLLTVWPTISGDYSSYALGGNLGIELNNRVTTLEGKITAVSFSPSLTSGKQIGVLTIDGVAKSLYAPSMYDWSEINAKPTKLSDFTDDVVAGKYQPLSTAINTSNIGEQMVCYAQRAGNAVDSETLGGLAPEMFAKNLNNATGINIDDTTFIGLRGGKTFAATGTFGYDGYSPFLEFGADGYTVQMQGRDGGFYARTCENKIWGNWFTFLHTGNYSELVLPRSGGRLQTASGTILSLNSINGSAIHQTFMVDNVQKSSLGWYDGMTYIGADSSSTARIGVTDGGVPQFWEAYNGPKHTLLHSGNISDYVHKSGIKWEYKTSATWNVIEAGTNQGIRVLNTIGESSTGAPSDFAVGLAVSGHYGFILAYDATDRYMRVRNCHSSDWNVLVDSGYLGANTITKQYHEGSSMPPLNGFGLWNGVGGYMRFGQLEEYSIGFRVSSGILQSLVTHGSTEGEWKTLINEGNISNYNAGSATKLQTARTIWGNSFDGTSDIGSNLYYEGTTFIYLSTGYTTFGNTARTTYIDGNGISFNASGAENMRINTSGNVTIGTTTDNGAKLQVEGNIIAKNSFSLYESDNIYFHLSQTPWYATIQSTHIGTAYLPIVINGYGGNVGIGTYNPQSTLDVNGSARVNEITIGGVKIDVANGALRVNGDVFSTGQFAAGEVGTATGGGILDYESIVDALGYTPANQGSTYTKQEVNDLLEQSSGSVGNNYMLYEINNGSHTIPNGVNSVIVDEDNVLYFGSITPEYTTKPCIVYLVKSNSYNLDIVSDSYIYTVELDGTLNNEFSVSGYMGMMLVWDTNNYRWMAYLQN